MLKLLSIGTLLAGILFSAEFSGNVTNNFDSTSVQNGRIILTQWSITGDSFISYMEQLTDVNGDFTFSNIDAGEYRLFIVADGYSIFTDYDLLISEDTVIDYQLIPSDEDGVNYVGQIVDSSQEGVGIPGTTISQWVVVGSQGFWEVISVTDGSGDFVFNADASTTLLINSLGFAPLEWSTSIMENADNVISLEPFSFDGSLSGFVIDNTDSRNILNAELTIYSTPADSMNSPGIYHVTSNDYGYYSIENIPNGEATIFVSTEGYEGYFNTVIVDNNTIHNISIDILPESGKIAGYVTYATTGGGVHTETDQTFIEFIPVSDGYQWVQAEIWNDGRYWVDLPAGEYVVACFQASSDDIAGERLLNRVYYYPESEVFDTAVSITVGDGEYVDDINFAIDDPTPSLSTSFYSQILNGYLDYYLETGLGKINYLLVAPPAEPEPGDIGDEIGVLDYGGMPSSGECTGMEGQVLAGAAAIGNTNSTIIIPVFEYINDCAATGTVTAGFIEGNPIHLMYWDTDLQEESFLTAEFSYGSFVPDSGGVSSPSLFGNRFTFVNVTSFPSNQQTLNLDYSEGWNLVGLPLLVEDSNYLSVFPDPITGTCYSYQSDQYVQSETLHPGVGYWLRFDESRGDGITGYTIDEVSIPIIKGWNLISSITENISVTMIEDPDDIIVPNTAYGFLQNGYQNVTDFVSGSGYWILSTNQGTITISEYGAGKTRGLTWSDPASANWLKINGTTLYFGFELSEDEMLSYSLPPKPPLGAFDVRFRGNMKYCKDNGIIEVMNPNDDIQMEYHIVKDEQWKLTGDMDEEIILSGDGILEFSGEITELSLEKVSSLPTEYYLHQNYPNPFNPITTISFSIPETESDHQDVSLKIFDITGRLVCTLLNESMKSGTHHIIWDSKDMNGNLTASGMYLYQLNTATYSKTKKLLLLK